jgi:hypothetical protein
LLRKGRNKDDHWTGCKFYQDDPATPQGINFDVMLLGGASFVIIRAGQNTWTDNKFAISWAAGSATLDILGYFFER